MILEYQYFDFKVKLEVLNYKESEIKVIKKAAQGMAFALGHPEFKNFCMNFSYKVKYCRWKLFKRKCHWKEFKQFHKSNGKSNIQVYNHIISGQEILPDVTQPDNEADVFLKIDRKCRKGVIGWTKKSIRWQYLCAWVFREKDWIYIAGNLTHEYLHKLNYGHSPDKNAHRKGTVPYAIGNWTRRFLAERKDIDF